MYAIRLVLVNAQGLIFDSHYHNVDYLVCFNISRLIHQISEKRSHSNYQHCLLFLPKIPSVQKSLSELEKSNSLPHFIPGSEIR